MEPFQPFRWNHGTEQDPLVVGTKQDPLVVGWNCSIGTEGDEEGGGWYSQIACCQVENPEIIHLSQLALNSLPVNC